MTVKYAGAQPHILSFKIGSAQAVPWLEEVVMGLQVTWTAKLTVDDPTNSEVASVTLDSLAEPCAQVDNEFQDVESLRQNGNELFRNANHFREYSKARLLYNRALNAASDEDIECRAAIRSNLALVALRTREWYSAVINADSADALLEVPSTKAGFRRSSGFFELKLFLRALYDITEVSQLDPDNVTIRRQQEELTEIIVETFTKLQKEFAEVYNVMPQSPLFKNPLLQ